MSLNVVPAHETSGAEEVAWDLSDLYAGSDDPAILRDLAEADRLALELSQLYRGRIAALSAAQMQDLLGRLETVEELAGLVEAYAYLSWAANTEDPQHGALLQAANERAALLAQELVFIELEVANAPEEEYRAAIASTDLRRYRHYFEVIRIQREHLLTEPEERILAEKQVTGRAAWSRFFDETHAAARYEFDGERLPQQKVLRHLYSPDRNRRRQAATAVTAGLREMRRTSAYVFNTILADKASDDRLRRYPSWIAARNLGNEVSDEIVEALVKAVTGRYGIVARYYRLKQRLLGLDQLFEYDRYAPLPDVDRRHSWQQAKQFVLDAYADFHPIMAETASEFFDRRWIDAAVRSGKVSGAFSHGTVPSAHPYVLLNFEGRTRDVSTLAHELGHAVHQSLARRQGVLLARTPLTTAETASVFGEMLVFQRMMRTEDDPRVRLAMLTGKIEDSIATVFRQVAMNRFEHAIHTARRTEGELAPDRFDTLWMESQRAMFQGSVELGSDYEVWWSYVPHFIHSPGYVYAYAFGELQVLALYARYLQVGAGFAEAYLSVLAAGGSDWPQALLGTLGVDLTEPAFWDNGLQVLEDMTAQAEQLFSA